LESRVMYSVDEHRGLGGTHCSA